MADTIHRSRISNTEWGLVIGALLMVDLVQILLNLFAIGIIVNRGISFIVGMAFSFYLHIRGEKLSDIKRLLGFLGTFGLEFVPGIDFLPLWAADGVYNMILAKRRDREAAKQEAGKAKEEKQKKMQIQAEQNEKRQAFRDSQAERDNEREERRLAMQNETNAIEDDSDSVYNKAA